MNFYVEQSARVQQKIDFVLKLVKTVDRVPEKFLKHLSETDGLYEIRVEWGSNIFRIFCCFDKGNLVVLFNGFQKKTQKTPRQELVPAEKLMNEYFSDKEKNKIAGRGRKNKASGVKNKKKIMSKSEQIRNVQSFDELLDAKYGRAGAKARERFDKKAKYFIISEMLKDARKEANMT